MTGPDPEDETPGGLGPVPGADGLQPLHGLRALVTGPPTLLPQPLDDDPVIDPTEKTTEIAPAVVPPPDPARRGAEPPTIAGPITMPGVVRPEVPEGPSLNPEPLTAGQFASFSGPSMLPWLITLIVLGLLGGVAAALFLLVVLTTVF